MMKYSQIQHSKNKRVDLDDIDDDVEMEEDCRNTAKRFLEDNNLEGSQEWYDEPVDVYIGNYQPRGHKTKYWSSHNSSSRRMTYCCGCPRRNCILILLVVVILMVGIYAAMIGLPMLFPRSSDGHSSSMEPGDQYFATNEMSDEEKLDYLKRVLGLEGKHVEITTVQENALSWLVIHDANLINEEDEDGLIERYAIAILFFSSSAYSGYDPNAKDTHEFHEFYESNDLLDTWLSNESVCDWQGINCGGSEKEGQSSFVDYIELPGIDLEGTIPTELALLTHLTNLWLSSNNLVGTIPSVVLTKLTDLTGIWLDINTLTGTLSPQVSSLSNLETLDIANNHLEGTIPLQELIPISPSLQLVSLWNNSFAGTIPGSELRELTELTSLWLGNNDLTGTIPPEISALSKLTWLTLPNNTLTGTLPVDMFLGLTKLTALDLFNNHLEGPIPISLGDLTLLESLDLCGNQLSGTIPEEMKFFLENLNHCCLGERRRRDGSVNGDPVVEDCTHVIGNNNNPNLQGIPSNCFA